ncbi:MAG: LemA family protein [Firmicutes bacterium]|nr:LemA family protein [Bacillota bacterium]MDD4262926.1 LemA family protein [Bacillota bacterium]MDD4693458.1 LemA family protein [Bacillota bacterium]
MKKGTIVLLVIIGILVLVGISFVGGYNNLVTLNESVDAQWGQVENQLQARYDKIPNIVATVQGYASHEKEVFQSIADARSRLAGATTVDEQVAASNQVESALARLLVVVENYPNLKADAQFNQLIYELSGTENRIATERMRYNQAVQDYNSRVKRFPTVLLANMFGYGPRTYFEAAAGAEVAPQVQF